MPKTKAWTEEDRVRALEWITRKARTGTLFRDHSSNVQSQIEDLSGIQDPERLAQYLIQCLLPDVWKRLLSALRSRKHDAKKRDQPTECPNCAVLQNKIAHLELSLKTAQSEIARLKAKPKAKPKPKAKETVTEDDDSLQRALELMALIEAEAA